MTVQSNAAHPRPRWHRPTAYSTTVETPPRFPKLVILRPPCGHALGVGVVWRRQAYLAWRSCR